MEMMTNEEQTVIDDQTIMTLDLTKKRPDSSRIPQKIQEVDFTYMDSGEMRKLSTVNVTSPELYELSSLKPMTSGALDSRLGCTENTFPCQTCGETKEDCPGHFGRIELTYPIFNVGYHKLLIHVLKCICKNCSRILLPDEDINRRLRALLQRTPQTISAKIERRKRMMVECEKVNVCPHCGAINGPVRKNKNLLIISHIVGQKNADLRSSFLSKFNSIQLRDVDLKKTKAFETAGDDLTPIRVRQLLDNIPKREIPLLIVGFENIKDLSGLVSSTMIVPPTCIRPPVLSSEGTNQDDLTLRVTDSVKFNRELEKAVENGLGPNNVLDQWNSLQQNFTTLVDADNSDTNIKKRDKPTIGISQRLKGKHGRFRTNLSGKRVNQSGRTVISPDPNVNIDQVVVPREMAMTLTFPTRVTKYNIKFLRQLIIAGPDKYPGANRVYSTGRNLRSDLRYGDRKAIAQHLEYGDIVERHLLANDIILFNRQPSLHRISIMAFRAKIMEWRTMRFNICTCTPFNADFDGDEMNIHLPQTLEAACDARVLMNILNNLFAPRGGELIVAPGQDFLSGTYLLSRKDVFMDYAHFTFYAAQIFDASIPLEIPEPAIQVPTRLWTGKQLISLMFKPNSKLNFHFTHQKANKEYNGKGRHMSVTDGWVHFMDSEMISGVLEKSLIGGGGKSLFAIIARDYSPKLAAVMMERIAKISVRFLMNRGFSIGITDVSPTMSLSHYKKDVVAKAYKESYNAISLLNEGKYEAKPGMTPAGTVEQFLNSTLSQVRNDCGRECLATLSKLNTALVMAKSGAKGSDLNISQMMVCIGQQIISGKRVIDDYIDRTLPHFEHHSIDPPSKGFVASSFFTGLTPYEFFFHTISGREGLVDSAVKTAETGYLQRRLMKSLEDLVIQYDNTVRFSDGTIVQFVYGGDGLDPLVMETKQFPVELQRLSDRLMVFHQNTPLLSPSDACDMANQMLSKYSNLPQFLPNTVRNFLFNKIIPAYQADYYPLLPEHETVVRSTMPVTEGYIDDFITSSMLRAMHAIVEPGTTVGAIAGQSIGEPATQMTLKSFHFAGIASMNVTLGVPRIQEVMNAVANIKFPYITVVLRNSTSEEAARIAKGLMDQVLLGQVSKSITEYTDETQASFEIELDVELIEQAQLNITNQSVCNAIENQLNKLKLTVFCIDERFVKVSFTGITKDELIFTMYTLRRKLPQVIVSGLKNIGRAHIGVGDDKRTYTLDVEGTNLLEVMTQDVVDADHTYSHHILDIEKVLGIEAANQLIVREVDEVYKGYGLEIDRRHLQLLSDTMTMTGKVNGITRHGLAKSSNSSLKLASFETTMEHLFNAGFHQAVDDATGASSCVILGKFAPIGSGLMDILVTDKLIEKPVLTVPQRKGMPKFLTPQPESRLREDISRGRFKL